MVSEGRCILDNNNDNTHVRGNKIVQQIKVLVLVSGNLSSRPWSYTYSHMHILTGKVNGERIINYTTSTGIKMKLLCKPGQESYLYSLREDQTLFYWTILFIQEQRVICCSPFNTWHFPNLRWFKFKTFIGWASNKRTRLIPRLYFQKQK